MPKFMPKGLQELHRWTRSDSIMSAYLSDNSCQLSQPTNLSQPLQGDGIGMSGEGVNADVIALKEEYVDEYGRLTTEQAKDILKNIFNRSLAKQFLAIDEYNDAQLDFALDVAANALIVDYDSFAAQLNRFKPWGMVKAALDIWDAPDAEDLHDEIEDNFDDLSDIAKGVAQRYGHVSMGSGGIMSYFKSLK